MRPHAPPGAPPLAKYDHPPPKPFAHSHQSYPPAPAALPVPVPASHQFTPDPHTSTRLLLPPPPHHNAVHTPVQVDRLHALLAHHPNTTFAQYVINGFSFGFAIGFTGARMPRRARNLPSASSRPDVITAYLAAECEAGHTAGPFTNPPFSNLVVSPLGAVPKKRSDKWRLIVHLSYPEGQSVNDGIDVADFPLKYMTVYEAMDSIMRLGRGAPLAKLDIKHAFRLCPIRAQDQHLLGMQWQGRYYFDQVLPFGLRSAPFIFNCLAQTVEWEAKRRGTQAIHHYLDDFLVVGAAHTSECSTALHTLTAICQELGIPLAEEKLEGPSTVLEFLGILLDTTKLEARLPEDKLTDLHRALDHWATRQRCTKRELLSLIGTLSFAAKVVPAGRTFLRRLIDTSTTTSSPNHHINLSDAARRDIAWWRAFATPWNGASFMLLPQWTPSPDLQLFTDSSGEIGFGAYFAGEWFQGRWTQQQLPRSIQWKELYPIVMATFVWGHCWATKKVLFACDNQAVVACIRSGTSHSPHMMALLRNMFFLAARGNFTVSARHVPGRYNTIADALSRFLMQEFRRSAPAAAPSPTPLPLSLPLPDA